MKVNTLLQNSGIISQSHALLVHTLYKQYAAMLLGYIVEVVKNRTIAEQYLIAVFKDVPHELDKFLKKDVNSFCLLQVMARKKLSDHFRNDDDHHESQLEQHEMAICNNKFTRQMNHEQQLVFCGVHWHGKTVQRLAAELDKPEEVIKRILKDCFTIIRSSR